LHRSTDLLEVAHSAVDELGTARGSAGDEKSYFSTRGNTKASRGRVERDSRAGGTTAHDEQVKRFGPRLLKPQKLLLPGRGMADIRTDAVLWSLGGGGYLVGMAEGEEAAARTGGSSL